MNRFYPSFACLFLIIASVIFAGGCGGRHVLFDEGASEYTIVIEPAAPETEQYAALELQTWIREVSGAELPIAGPEAAAEGRRLVVGWQPLTVEAFPGAGRPEDGDDSFTWRSHGGDIHFWGGSRRGTLYAVYSFLEEALGCRWYSSKVSVAPPRSRWSFRKLDHSEAPGIRIRDNCVLDVRENPVFSARMRNNFIKVPGLEPGTTVPGSAVGYWGVHALGHHVPSSVHFHSHPEYFSLRDGVRQGGYAQPCLSNPDVLAMTIESVKKVMREQPDYLIYSVEQNDNQLFCTCDSCQELAERYGGQSGVMLWFVNQVADAVKDEFPGKYIGTFAYQYTRHAPKGIVPRENVVVRLCSIECCMLHDYDGCEQNFSFAQDLEDWGAIAPHLYIWDYVTDFTQYCLPVANWWTLQSHIRDFRDAHAIGILEEGDYQTPSCELREMRSWLLSKLMWNPDADMDELIRDFTDGYYGAAGRNVREYLQLEDRILRREGIHAPCYISASDSMYTSEFISEGRKIFARAREAVKGDRELLDRLETAEMPLCFLLMEKDPPKGFETGADALVRRVIAREGISRMTEWERGGKSQAEVLLEKYENLAEALDKAPLLLAVEEQASGNGVAFTRYEGPFMSTAEMMEKGTVTDSGTLPTVRIEEEGELDHFGYVFTTLLEAREEGIHQFSVTSDDGFVLILDGKELISMDGSHSPEMAWAFANLAKGLHRLEIRYFEDCEGQLLDINFRTPGGYVGPLPEDRLFK